MYAVGVDNGRLRVTNMILPRFVDESSFGTSTTAVGGFKFRVMLFFSAGHRRLAVDGEDFQQVRLGDLPVQRKGVLISLLKSLTFSSLCVENRKLETLV